MMKSIPNQECYVPTTLISEREVSLTVEGSEEALETIIDMSWASGMIGVLPVFSSLEKAKSYAGKGIDVVVFSVPDSTEGGNDGKAT